MYHVHPVQLSIRIKYWELTPNYARFRPSNSPTFRRCHPDFVKITRSPGRVVNHPPYSGKIWL